MSESDDMISILINEANELEAENIKLKFKLEMVLHVMEEAAKSKPDCPACLRIVSGVGNNEQS